MSPYFDVGGVHGIANVAEMWKNHFEQIYNCIDMSVDKSKLLSRLNCMQNEPNFTVRDLMLVAQNQKLSKACGLDGLYMKSYIYGSHKLFVHITMMFNLFLKHAYIPKSCI